MTQLGLSLLTREAIATTGLLDGNQALTVRGSKGSTGLGHSLLFVMMDSRCWLCKCLGR